MARKSIKETIREAMSSGKKMKPSESTDPFFIGNEDPAEEPGMMDEMVGSAADEIGFDDIEKIGDGSKLESEQKGKAKGEVTEGTEAEAPPEPAPAETTTAHKETGTDALAVGTDESENITPAKPAGSGSAPKRWKVTTVEGEEEVDEPTLVAGYMMKKHYTRSQQILHEKERRITGLLADPAALVEFAIQNGVDLKPLVHAQPSIQEIVVPPLPEYPTEEQIASHKLLTMLAEDRKTMAKRLESVEKNVTNRSKDQQWSGVSNEFESERGDIPKSASFLAMLLYREGIKQFGPNGYSMKQAVRDLKIGQGDIVSRAFESPEGKKKIAEIERQAVEKYLKTKKVHTDESAAGDILPPARVLPRADERPRFRNAREGAEAAKKKFGIFG